MSSTAGRRHKQISALSAPPALTAAHTVMRVVAARGANAFDLVSPAGARGLYALPARLRHVVFIRPGSTVLVLDGGGGGGGGGKVRGDIDAVVLALHLKQMRQDKLWPRAWREEDEADNEGHDQGQGQGQEEDSGSESEIEANPNTRKADRYSDSEEG